MIASLIASPDRSAVKAVKAVKAERRSSMAHVVLRVDRDGHILEDVPCSSCNASLKGAGAGGLCPACGANIAVSLIGRAVVLLNEGGRIDEPVRCTACGHILRGVDPQGECPECRTPVGPALESNLLRYAGATWVKKVADGLMLYLIALLFTVAMGFANAGVAFALRSDPALRALIGLAVSAVTCVFLTIAIWWVTAADPDTPPAHQKRLGANLARYLIIPQYVLTLPGMYLASIAASPEEEMRADLVQMPAGALGILVGVGVLLHFAVLARRVVDEKLERWARVILWISVIGSSVALVGGVVSMASMLASGASPGSGNLPQSGPALIGLIGGGLAGCTGGLASLIAMIWQIVLIVQLRRAFAAAVRSALTR